MKILSLIRPALFAALALVAGQGAAAVSPGPNVVDTLQQLKVDFVWDGEFKFEPQTFAYFGNYWKVQGSLTALALPGLLYGSGGWSAQHLGDALAGEAPGEMVYSSFSTYFDGVSGGVTGFDVTLSVPHQHGQDTYVWKFDKATSTAHLSAVHAVPEPETYAMLLAGIGVVAWRLRRRSA